MTTEDTITIIGLVIIMILAALLGILIRQGRLRPEILPRLLGIGGGLITLVVFIGFSILDAPETPLLDEMPAIILWSLAIGIIAYLSGRAIVSRSRPRN